MKTLAFRSRSCANGAYLVLLHTSAPPDTNEWKAYVRAVATLLAEARGPLHAFVATDGGSPDAAQRRVLAEAFNRGNALTHVFTTDAFVRGVVTAFRWIARARAAAHSPDDFLHVCNEVGLIASEVLADFVEAEHALDVQCAMLASIRASMRPTRARG
jgi:hypothetical protein